MTAAGIRARERWSQVMRELHRRGITQESISRALSDDEFLLSTSAVQKWATGTNLPDFVSIGRLLAWQGRDGWLTLWALGLNREELIELAQGILDAIRTKSWLTEGVKPIEKNSNTEDLRRVAFRKLVEDGATLEQVGELFGISRQRVWQILNEK